MYLVFITECRFIKKNKNIYCENGEFTNKLWNRYLSAFDKITIYARVKNDECYEANSEYLASSEKVSFVELPYYIGPLQYLKVKRKISRIISKNIHSGDAYICRVPGTLGTEVSKQLRKQNIPYAVEVVGDPYDVFASGAIKHPLRSLFRYKGCYDLRKTVKHSSSALYVTQKALQLRYPTKIGVPQFNASDVSINDGLISNKYKQLNKSNQINLISIGSLEQMYKAPDILIKAISILDKMGIICNLKWLGDGKYKWEMMNYANELGIIKQINFLGNVSKETVFEELNKADIYIQASRTEGLPRAVIEAMSQGLPCIGTNIGGIPELLNSNALVPINDPIKLAHKIKEFIVNPEIANEEAQRNLKESHKYKESVLTEIRSKFYTEIINFSK